MVFLAVPAGQTVSLWLRAMDDMTGIKLILTLSILWCLSACWEEHHAVIVLHEPPSLNDGLSIGSFHEVRLDSAKLLVLIRKITGNEFKNVNSLLIYKSNKLVLEEYFNGSNVDQIHTMQSVTKSITSLLVGAMADRGLMDDLHRPVIDFFPEYNLENMSDWKEEMTVANLLTMQTGINWSENPYAGSNLQTLNESSMDWVKYVLDQPMRESPGTVWQYNSGGCIVFSGLIKNVTGKSADQFCKEVLFNPLGITAHLWAHSRYNGIPHTGGGLSLRARDMLKIGVMVLDSGKWKGQSVFSPAWINASTQRHATTQGRGNYPAYYGYYWWLLPRSMHLGDDHGDDIITASGAQGQWIFVLPKDKMVVAVTGSGQNGKEELAGADFLYSDILEAIE